MGTEKVIEKSIEVAGRIKQFPVHDDSQSIDELWSNIGKIESFELSETGLTARKPAILFDTKVNLLPALRKAFEECCKNVGCQKKRIELLTTYLTLSNGNVIFELSCEDVARELFKGEIASEELTKKRMRQLKVRVSERLETLESWQSPNGIEFIRVIRKGYGTKGDQGRYGWKKIKFELVFLSQWIQILVQNPEVSFESNIEKLKANYCKK